VAATGNASEIHLSHCKKGETRNTNVRPWAISGEGQGDNKETKEGDSMFNQKEKVEKHNTRATIETHMQQGQ
jgi:hypothetical protein